MKTIFGEVFTKISNGILIGCLGAILICWGFYETSDTMMLVGIVILCVGFMLAVTNENRNIREKKKSDERIKRLEKRVEIYKDKSEKFEDAVMYLTQDMEVVSNELKKKNVTIERYKKIKLSALKDSEVWSESEDN